MMKRILITGSGGLVGSACVLRFCENGWTVRGIDCDARAEFFGREASTADNAQALAEKYDTFLNGTEDITHVDRVASVVASFRPDAIIHAAAQPSHDLAAKIPMRDFDVNARATLGLLEAAKNYAPGIPFVYLSTNKVYGDSVNAEEFYETDTRFEFSPILYSDGYQGSSKHSGWGETRSVDQTAHSLFGCSKLAADIATQEYGLAGWLQTACLRAGCLTGGDHAGVELHGFLSYLARCIVRGDPYTIFGYRGKQVRDNLHADDVAAFCEAFIASPRKAEVYNLGGGKENSCSVLEAIAVMEEMVGRPFHYETIGANRRGDHRVYYSDLRKCREQYPSWRVTRDLPWIYEELVRAWSDR